MVGEFTPIKDKKEAAAKVDRPTNEGTLRGITVRVEQEVFRAVKLIAVDSGRTTNEVMLEAIELLRAKHEVPKATLPARR